MKSMKFTMNKRGDLSLSITAIVVIVIAFVVLGLGLSLTRTIFKGAQEKLPEAFAVTQLEAEPTSENPITITQTVEIARNKQKTMKIGYYNRNQNTATNAKFTITKCSDSLDQEVASDKLPRIASPAENVGPSSSVGYSLIFTEQGLTAGTYICTIAVCDAGACSTSSYEKKQFFLQVTA